MLELLKKIISPFKTPAEIANAIHLPFLFLGLGKVCDAMKTIFVSWQSFTGFSLEEFVKTTSYSLQAYEDYKNGKGWKTWLPEAGSATATLFACIAAAFAASEAAALEAFVAPGFATALGLTSTVHLANTLKAMFDETVSWKDFGKRATNTVLTPIAVAAVADALIAKDKEYGRFMLITGGVVTGVTGGLAILDKLSCNKQSLFCCKNKQPKQEKEEIESLLKGEGRVIDVIHRSNTAPSLV